MLIVFYFVLVFFFCQQEVYCEAIFKTEATGCWWLHFPDPKASFPDQ